MDMLCDDSSIVGNAEGRGMRGLVQIAVFQPGVYVIADYMLHWGGHVGSHSGQGMQTRAGPPFLLTVQAAS